MAHMLRWLGTAIALLAMSGVGAPHAGAMPAREIAKEMASAYAATFVAQTVPAVLEIGAVGHVSITMRNTGTATWRVSDGDVFLATQRPQDNYYWCIQDNRYADRRGNRVLLPRDVGPGEDVTFAFDVKPLTCVFAAQSPLRFRMLSQTYGTFGDETPDPQVGVTTGAEFVAQQVPARMSVATNVQVTVTYRNTTPAPWATADGYVLAPVGSTAWGVASVPLPAAVASGDTVRLAFVATAPSVAGNYVFQWQLKRADGTPIGQLSPVTTVAVEAAGPANYQGLWWAAPAGSESGWGMNLAHQEDVIFATWFTYDALGKPWWLSMTANRTAEAAYTGNLVEQTGPPFNAVPFTPSQVRGRTVGPATLTFTDAGNGTLDAVVDNVRLTKKITRQVFGVVPTCTFDARNDLALAYNYQDLWWAAPAGLESGWGVNFTHQGDVIFATWFTYAADRTPTWVSATLPRTPSGTYDGIITRTTGPAFDAAPFDPANVVATPAGTMTLTFANGNSATFATTLDGVTQSKAITRQVFRTPGTVCQ